MKGRDRQALHPEKFVEIYRPQSPVTVQNFSASLSGKDVLPGFTLDLAAIFDD